MVVLLIDVTGGAVVVELTVQDAGILVYGVAEDPVARELLLVRPG